MMRELPGDVFVAGQISPAQMQVLAEQGIRSVINNRPNMEAPLQPLSDDVETAAQAVDLGYAYIPMAGGLSADLIEASVTAFNDMPRPIIAFCASGMRSAVLWAFAHAEEFGVDGAMTALAEAGFNLEQIRQPLTQYVDSRAG